MDEAASAYTFDRDQAAQQLDLMFGTDRGWLELACIDGPPDAEPKPDMQTKGWHVWSIQREAILDRIGELTVKYGNVYTCVSLFDRSYNRAKRYAKPGRVILVDDALVAGCTFAIETSPGNYQSMLLLDREEDAATREQIARRAAYANGGDHGGWDCTQMCRIGGTVNNKQKYGEPHQVRLVVGSGQTYSADELLARWPATVLPSTATGNTSIDWHAVALQRGNLERLVNADGIPRRLKPGTFSYRVLTGEVTVPDRSVRRKMISKGVVGVGYPDDEAAAILQALCDYGHSAEKGTDWLNQDIARCIAKSREEWAAQGVTITVVPSHGGLTQPAAPLQDTLRKSRARKDRPQRLTTLDYYDDICQRADAEGRVNETRIQAAARLNISVPTVARFEHELTERGFLKRHTVRKRGATTSYLQVSRINIESAPQLGPASTAELVVSQAQPQNAEIAQQNAENHDAALPIEGTHRPDSSSLVTRPVVRAAPETVLDAVSAACDIKGNDAEAAWRYFRRTFPHLVVKLSPNFAVAKNKFIADLYESELAFRECAPEHAGALDIVQLGQVRANRRLEQPPLLDVTGVRAIGVQPPRNEQTTGACVPSLPDVQAQSRIETQQVQATAASAAPVHESSEIAPIRLVQAWRYKQNAQGLAQGATP